MNITISAYQFEKRFKDVDIMTLINSFIKDSYKKEHKLEDWKSYKSKFDNLVELRTNYENYNWVWYGINNKKSLVVISINKETEINQSEINLLMFMIENLIIN
jgi:predicted patatin/cPLA2 family phospholipase